MYLDFVNMWNTSEAPWNTGGGSAGRFGGGQILREHSATSMDGRQHSILVRALLAAPQRWSSVTLCSDAAARARSCRLRSPPATAT